MPLLKPILGSQVNKTHPLSYRLAGCWPFTERSSNQMWDYSGGANKATVVGSIGWTTTTIGCALDFPGSGHGNNYLSLVRPINLNDFTIEFVANLDSNTIYDVIAGDGVTSGDRLSITQNTGVIVEINNSIYTLSGVTNFLSLQHLVVVRTGSTLRLYRNGLQTGSDLSASSGQFTIGFIGSGWNSGHIYPLDGKIVWFRVYDRALSACEIGRLYTEPFCMFERPTAGRFSFISAGQEVLLTGALSAQSNISATASLTKRISGSTNPSASLTASLKVTRKLVGLCPAGTNVAATLKRTSSIQGTIGALANITGSLSLAGEVRLAGTINAVSHLTAVLAPTYPGAWFAASLQIEKQWLIDALFNGITTNAFRLGTTLSLGWFWMRLSGCCVLYRGPSTREIDFANVLSVTEQDTDTVSPPNYLPHSSRSTYFYVIRRFNHCGDQERTLAASVKVSIDADGNLTKPQPNNIFAASAEQVDGKKIQLVWFYSPLAQKSQPACFKIYHDAASGQINYENPIATIAYQGRKFYNHKTDALDSGRHLFAVRAEDAAGVQNSSLARSTIQLVTEIPEAMDILSAESV